MALPTPKETKDKFLKSEYNKWEYWKQFKYSKYLSVMAQDAVKCKCGTYYWKRFKKKCGCKQGSCILAILYIPLHL